MRQIEPEKRVTLFVDFVRNIPNVFNMRDKYFKISCGIDGENLYFIYENNYSKIKGKMFQYVNFNFDIKRLKKIYFQNELRLVDNSFLVLNRDSLSLRLYAEEFKTSSLRPNERGEKFRGISFARSESSHIIVATINEQVMWESSWPAELAAHDILDDGAGSYFQRGAYSSESLPRSYVISEAKRAIFYYYDDFSSEFEPSAQ